MTAVSAKIARGESGETDSACRSMFRNEPLGNVRKKHIAEIVTIEGAEEDEGDSRVFGRMARYR